jgi:hypothetical protein
MQNLRWTIPARRGVCNGPYAGSTEGGDIVTPYEQAYDEAKARLTKARESGNAYQIAYAEQVFNRVLVAPLLGDKYPVVQFTREPDEHLLDGSDNSVSGSLQDAGFGSQGPM